MNAPDRTQWLAERRAGIGGSDVAAILGLSPWKTPLAVYLDKIGQADEQPDNAAMAWGRALEPVIRQAYSDETGRDVATFAEALVHPDHAFMRANVDGLTNDERVFEAKTARTAHDWGEPGSDQVPLPYLLQVQHYMAVTGYAVADVAVLIGGSDFRIYEVPADAELQAGMIDSEAEFWQRVVDRNPPEPITLADARERWGRSDAAGIIEATSDTLARLESLRKLKAQIDELTSLADDAQAAVLRALGDKGDTLTHNGHTLATWKLAKARETFDVKRFRADHPELFAQYAAAGVASRRFLLKEIAA